MTTKGSWQQYGFEKVAAEIIQQSPGRKQGRISTETACPLPWQHTSNLQ